MSLPPPLRFGHYRVLQREDGTPHELGSGSMGVTYKAVDERLKLEVALKVIAPMRLNDPKVQALFLREARAAARVRHSHVASVLALDDTPGHLFYAMEFVPGITLQALLQERRRLPAPLAVEIARQVALALEAIHREGLIHRDLKPANLMLIRSVDPSAEGGETWEAKLIDFGLARTLEGPDLAGVSAARTQGFRGTATYASPEQCLERSDLDGRADLYSLGCILCEMLLGRPPFLANSHHEVMTQHVSTPLPWHLLAGTPEPLRPLLSALLAKEPSARPSSAGAVARQLEQLGPALEAHVPPALDGVGSDAELAFGSAPTLVGSTRRTSGTKAEPKSIAVLALANLSADRENEYFSDGISDELLHALSKIPGFRVAARTSSFYFKGKSVPLAEVAKQLSVGYLVDGSVRRAGDRVRISVQLVAASDGFPIWSDTFERELKDVFAVQDEIARIVAQNLQLRLGTVTEEPRPVDPEAFRLYLEGRHTLQFRTPEAMARCEQLLRRALTIEPQFPRALGALANLLVLRADYGFLENGSWDSATTLRDEADRLAGEALGFDAAEAEAIGARGMAAWSRGDMPAAIQLVREALTINPSSAPTHHILARALGANGQLDESIQHIQQALTLDPLSPRIADNCALALLFAGRFAEALVMAERGLVGLPGDPQIVAWRAWALGRIGRGAEAIEAAREVIRRGGTWVYYVACDILLRAGLVGEAEAAATQAASGPVMSHVFCQVAMGRAESAIRLIPRKLGAMFFEELLYPPMWDPVRNHPDYVRLLADLGLTDAHARALAWRARSESSLAG